MEESALQPLDVRHRLFQMEESHSRSWKERPVAPACLKLGVFRGAVGRYATESPEDATLLPGVYFDTVVRRLGWRSIKPNNQLVAIADVSGRHLPNLHCSSLIRVP